MDMGTNVTFIVAPEIAGGATSGVVLGDFNNWTYDYGFELQKHNDGSLQAKAELEPGRTYQYRYLLNDGRWVNDGSAQSYVPANGFFVDNCVITVPEEQPAINVESGTFIPDITTENDGSSKTGLDQFAVFENEEQSIEATVEPIVKQRKATTGKTKTPKAALKSKKEDIVSDDLTKISGINKKIIALLGAANINSYKSLAKLSGKKIKTMLESDPKLSKLDVGDWSKQAKLAANGSWDELTALQKEKKK